MKKTVLLFTAITILFSCSSPLDRKYSEENLQKDAKEIKESGKLKSEDLELLAGWIMKSKFQGNDLSDKTYNEIINEAKSFKKEQEELASKAKKEAEIKKKRMQETMIISIFDKGFTKSDWETYNSFSYVVKNKSNKDIKAFKFSFKIYDVLGDEIGDGYRVSSTDKIIKANEESKKTIYYDFNQFMNKDIIIKNAKFKDLSFDIKVDKIVFTDNSVLE